MRAKKLLEGLILVMALCFTATGLRAQDTEETSPTHPGPERKMPNPEEAQKVPPLPFQGFQIFVVGGGSQILNRQSFTELYIPYTSTYAVGAEGTVGVEVPWKQSRLFGLEGSFSYGQDNLKITDQNTNPTTEVGYSLRNMRVSADLVAHAPDSFWGVYPYAVVGVEWDEFNPTSSAQTAANTYGFGFEAPPAGSAKLGSQSAAGANFGGGLDYKLSKKLEVRLDIRCHITTSPTFGLPSAQPSVAGPAWYPVAGNAKNIEAQIGFVYHFHQSK